MKDLILSTLWLVQPFIIALGIWTICFGPIGRKPR